MPDATAHAPTQRFTGDFWKFLTGQSISTLGSSFTSFALPLLIFKLTGSALNLAFTVVATVLPYLLLGLVIGAWADSVQRKHLPLSTLVLGALALEGLMTAAAAFTHLYPLALLCWLLRGGWDALFIIGSYSLVQDVAPNQFLGRVITTTRVLTWSTASIGALLGGFAIEQTRNVGLVYIAIGSLVFVIALAFWLTPLRDAR